MSRDRAHPRADAIGRADERARSRGHPMMMRRKAATATLTAFVLALTAASAAAKDAVKVGFIGPLTGGVSVNGIGGRNSADLAVKLRNADPDAKYEYELVVL